MISHTDIQKGLPSVAQPIVGFNDNSLGKDELSIVLWEPHPKSMEVIPLQRRP